jgi:hypothetical protein
VPTDTFVMVRTSPQGLGTTRHPSHFKLELASCGFELCFNLYFTVVVVVVVVPATGCHGGTGSLPVTRIHGACLSVLQPSEQLAGSAQWHSLTLAVTHWQCR